MSKFAIKVVEEQTYEESVTDDPIWRAATCVQFEERTDALGGGELCELEIGRGDGPAGSAE